MCCLTFEPRADAGVALGPQANDDSERLAGQAPCRRRSCFGEGLGVKAAACPGLPAGRRHMTPEVIVTEQSGTETA